MTIDQLRSFRNATPFRPFEIHLADGRMLVVEFPDRLALSPTCQSIGVALPDDTIEVVDRKRITALKPLQKRRSNRNRRT